MIQNLNNQMEEKNLYCFGENRKHNSAKYNSFKWIFVLIDFRLNYIFGDMFFGEMDSSRLVFCQMGIPPFCKMGFV